MKYFKFLLVGVFFGIILFKAEVVSWFRIYEMFKFESFHMYGVIGSAVILGIVIIQVLTRFKMKNYDGEHYEIEKKEKGIARYLFGGIMFGGGWALTGACPGPLFILLGNSESSSFLIPPILLISKYSPGIN